MSGTTTETAGGADDSLRTRQSLLTRLKDWNDHAGWREFFDTYWRLIYNVARKSGLGDQDAQDLVQDVLLGVAKQMPEGRYDRSKGRFKQWLCGIVRHRIVDHWRKHGREAALTGPLPERDSQLGAGESDLERVWQSEWAASLLTAALGRVQEKVSARNFLIYDLSVVRETPTARISEMLGVSAAQVFLVRHRVGRLVRSELRTLEEGS
ncbi:MAG: RNA polymerase sigma-70 factor, ECF subfamily [Verrucomicrobia bacterium]|jgi:RNA polymerase sigma-70 factor (ECF subfamily)|nr:MAG: RNA polymerase sigma-70 factor, ECF subfamily [Verrucomicrobiota bacterium]